jgi:hypothetical protein
VACPRTGRYFRRGFTGTSTTAGFSFPLFHPSNDSVTLATPLPALSSARTGLRQYSPQSSASRTVATIGLPPFSFGGYSITAVGQAPRG